MTLCFHERLSWLVVGCLLMASAGIALLCKTDGFVSAVNNLRVLEWILARCDDKVDAVQTAIGYVPKAEDINIEGLDDITIDTVRELLTVDNASWLEDIENIKEFYALVGDRVPAEMYEELDALEARLKA